MTDSQQPLTRRELREQRERRAAQQRAETGAAAEPGSGPASTERPGTLFIPRAPAPGAPIPPTPGTAFPAAASNRPATEAEPPTRRSRRAERLRRQAEEAGLIGIEPTGDETPAAPAQAETTPEPGRGAKPEDSQKPAPAKKPEPAKKTAPAKKPEPAKEPEPTKKPEPAKQAVAPVEAEAAAERVSPERAASEARAAALRRALSGGVVRDVDHAEAEALAAERDAAVRRAVGKASQSDADEPEQSFSAVLGLPPTASLPAQRPEHGRRAGDEVRAAAGSEPAPLVDPDAQRRLENTGIIAPVTQQMSVVLPAAQAPAPSPEESTEPVKARSAHGLDPLEYSEGGVHRTRWGTVVVVASAVVAVAAIIFAFVF